MSNAFFNCRFLTKVPIDLFSKCPNITETEGAFANTKLSEQKQNEILSNTGSYYKKR